MKQMSNPSKPFDAAYQGAAGAFSEEAALRFIGEQAVLLPCLILSLMTYAFQHLTRGTLSGNGRFGPYGLILAAEGIYRMVPAMILYALGVDNLFLYGLVFALPPIFASLTARWLATRSRRKIAQAGR